MIDAPSRTIDLADADRQLTDSETSDVIHRADYPRMAVRAALGEGACAVMTSDAIDIADARCGVPLDHDGPHPNRGTLRWYRHYLSRLDDFADAMVPDWRNSSHSVSPFPWCEAAFGPAMPPCTAPLVGETYGRDSYLPHVVGNWTFDLPRWSA